MLCALHANEARWRSLLENTHDWVWGGDANGRYTYASPHVLEMLGYTPEEVLGKTPFGSIPTRITNGCFARWWRAKPPAA